jgi:GH24 family phage-related lysozyme (muramidase)
MIFICALTVLIYAAPSAITVSSEDMRLYNVNANLLQRNEELSERVDVRNPSALNWSGEGFTTNLGYLVTAESLDLMKQFEGFYSRFYLCSSHMWTIGFGINVGLSRTQVPPDSGSGTSAISNDQRLWDALDNRLNVLFTRAGSIHHEELAIARQGVVNKDFALESAQAAAVMTAARYLDNAMTRANSHGVDTFALEPNELGAILALSLNLGNMTHALAIYIAEVQESGGGWNEHEIFRQFGRIKNSDGVLYTRRLDEAAYFLWGYWQHREHVHFNHGFTRTQRDAESALFGPWPIVWANVPAQIHAWETCGACRHAMEIGSAQRST